MSNTRPFGVRDKGILTPDCSIKSPDGELDQAPTLEGAVLVYDSEQLCHQESKAEIYIYICIYIYIYIYIIDIYVCIYIYS